MISIEKLSVSYNTSQGRIRALDNINLKIEEGEIYSVLGPTGCGKSTLLKVLGGIITEYEGMAMLNEEKFKPSEHRIGYVLQNYGLLPWRNIYSNTVLGVEIKDGKKNINKDFAKKILKSVGLEEFIYRYPSQLSGGQRQRAAVARAFVLKPELLLMDEPFSALDAMTREDMQELFFKVWRENSVTTIFVTHSIEEALYVGSRIVILSKAPGSVVMEIKNPLFGTGDLRMKKEFYSMAMDIRKIVKESWSN
jgi:NitT/TauT family transport system ATP-binding protein